MQWHNLICLIASPKQDFFVKIFEHLYTRKCFSKNSWKMNTMKYCIWISKLFASKWTYLLVPSTCWSALPFTIASSLSLLPEFVHHAKQNSALTKRCLSILSLSPQCSWTLLSVSMNWHISHSSYKWIYLSMSGLFYIAEDFQGSFMSQHVSEFYSFLWLSTVPLRVYSSCCWAVHVLKDTFSYCECWLLTLVAFSSLGYKLGGSRELLHHEVLPYSSFEELTNFSTEAISFYIPTSNSQVI